MVQILDPMFREHSPYYVFGKKLRTGISLGIIGYIEIRNSSNELRIHRDTIINILTGLNNFFNL